MSGRTFAIGDIHGDLAALETLVSRLPRPTSGDTMVFIGDYVDRGPKSREVVEVVRSLQREANCRVIALRGNHEDAWLRVVDGDGFPQFVFPRGNGAFESLRSFVRGEQPGEDDPPNEEEMKQLLAGSFFPPDVLDWFRGLPYFYEDEHAIYVHAGLPQRDGRFLHPSEVDNPIVMLWLRTESFFRDYRGKPVVIGHTRTEYLPPELSLHTPDDPTDLWAGECVIALDTGAGKGGFLSCIELPAGKVYESR
ncbi:MAG: serine/threonine protein phosphatase [Deltaproteobacteria bacterium]|nr:serine/threonine protein phosphatase [Deltaproteobacteria bacterium]